MMDRERSPAMTDPLLPPLPADPAPQHRPDLSGRMQAHLAPPATTPDLRPDPPQPTDATRRRVGAAGGLDKLL
jgi:hypothetical protein